MKAEEVYIKVKADTTDIDELEKKINKLSNETENIAKRLKESIDDGIMIFEKNICIGCFEINYCPKCGSKLVKK